LFTKYVNLGLMDWGLIFAHTVYANKKATAIKKKQPLPTIDTIPPRFFHLIFTPPSSLSRIRVVYINFVVRIDS
jgi:hypothetical protein